MKNAADAAIRELAEFLAVNTALATIDPSAAGLIAIRLYRAGWRRSARPTRITGHFPAGYSDSRNDGQETRS